MQFPSQRRKPAMQYPSLMRFPTRRHKLVMPRLQWGRSDASSRLNHARLVYQYVRVRAANAGPERLSRKMRTPRRHGYGQSDGAPRGCHERCAQ
jgi:hypothetical protein